MKLAQVCWMIGYSLETGMMLQKLFFLIFGDLRMKKSLFALAALGAFAGAAQAQSSVTLYGTIDLALTYINNAGMQNGAAAPTAAGTATSTPTTGNALAMTDYGIFSNVWGLKGQENLGGGLYAAFNLESDIIGLNGSIYSNSTNRYNQLFRRAANVAIGGTWGEIRMGQQQNPLVGASAALLPVEGNTVNAIRTYAGYSMGDFVANSISYQTPVMNGFQAKALYSINNQTDDTSGGSAWAANAFYNIGKLDFTAGYNQQTSTNGAYTTSTGYAACSTLPSSTVAPCDLSSNAVVNNAKFGGNLKGYVAGVKYAVTPALNVGYAFGHADYDPGTSGLAAAYNSSSQMLGLGYQSTPQLLLGLNYIVSNLDTRFYNAQARYSLSKRTMLYAQVSMAQNGSGSYQNGLGTPFGNWVPVQVDTSGNPGPVAGLAGLPNTTQTAYGLGVVHMF
jgi:predicted porin